MRWLAVVTVVGFGLRAAWAVYAARTPVGVIDPLIYSLHAETIADGEGYSWFFGEDTAYYPPGYPISLGVLLWLVRLTPLPDGIPAVAAWYSVVVGTATILLVADLARRLLRSTAAGVVAGALIALWPNLVLHSSLALSETLFNALVVAAVLVLVATPWDRGRLPTGRLVAFGVLLAAATYVRPISALLLATLLAVLVRAGFGWRRALGHVAVVTAVVVVLIAPWTIRNWFVMDAPVLMSTNFGDNLCIGHREGADGKFELAEDCLDGYDPDLSRAELEVERNSTETRRALSYMVRNPAHELELLPKRFWYTMFHDHDGLDAAQSYGRDQWLSDRADAVLEWVSDAWWYAALALSAVSLVLLRRPPRARFLLVATTVALILPPLVFFGDPRFHVPIVPFMAIAVAGGVVAAAQLLRERRPAAHAPRAG